MTEIKILSMVMLVLMVIGTTQNIFLHDMEMDGTASESIPSLGSQVIRSSNTKTMDGGYFYDDFSNNNNIENMFRTSLFNNSIQIKPPAFFEDFESYTNGQSILSPNGWVLDKDFNSGTATASTIIPNSPSKTVGVFKNDDTSGYQNVLSPAFDVARGTALFWFRSNYIFSDDHSSCGIHMVNTLSNPYDKSNERAISIGCQYGGWTSYNGDHITHATIYADTWYQMRTDWDCSTDKYSTYVYTESGALIGSGVDLDFRNPSDSIKRFSGGCGPKSRPTAFEECIDDLTIFDWDSDVSGSIQTKEITLENGQMWSTLGIDKNEPEDTYINVSILDNNGNPIHGFSYDKTSSEFDLRELNNMGVRSIKLNFTFVRTLETFPVLKGYGVDWNSTNSYFDALITDINVDDKVNVIREGNSILLENNKEIGKIISVSISIPPGCYWDAVEVEFADSLPSKIYIDLIDTTTGQPIVGYSNMRSSSIDISNLDPSRFNSVKIQVVFEEWGGASPKLYDWSISWIPNTETVIQSMDIPGSIHRGDEYLMELDIIDFEQPVNSLDISVEAKKDGSDIWTDEIIGDISYNGTSNKFDVLLSPPLTTNVGTYELRCIAMDDRGNVFSVVFQDNVTILNNVPTPPVIKLQPENAMTGSDLKAVMVREGSDVETDSLVYSYRWFINGEPLSLYDSDSVQPFTDRMIDSVETEKGDMVSLMVYSFDGLNLSDPFLVSVLIGNTPPIIQPDFPGNVSLMEDQENDTVLRFDEIAYDVDGDDIEIFSTEPLNVTMDIDVDGKVIFFSPDENWFGDEMVTLTVSDGDNITYQDLLIEVLPVNDLPEGSILQPVGNLDIEVGDKVTFNADAADIETEKEDLEYTWMAGEEVLSTEPYFAHIFQTVGLFNISCLVSDGEDEVSLGSILINVVDTTPDYLKDNFQRNYPDNGKAIVYDVVDFKGNVKNVREDEGGKLDIISLSSELKGENVRVTMNLASAPDNATSGEAASTSVRYYVYFVKDEWSEPEFDSKLTGPETADRVVPLSQYFYNVGTYGSLGYLSFGTENDFGSPFVDGSSIIWTVPAVLIVNSGMELEDYGLYGLSLQTSETSMIITKGFDTIGKGSTPHQITGQPETLREHESENGASSLLMGLVIGAIILLVIFIILLTVMILMMRKKGGPSEGGPASEASQIYAGDEVPLTESSADIAAGAATLPYEEPPGALPTSSDMEVNTGQLPQVEPPAKPGPVPPPPVTESTSPSDVPVQPMMTGPAPIRPPVPPQPGSGSYIMDGQQPPSA